MAATKSDRVYWRGN